MTVSVANAVSLMDGCCHVIAEAGANHNNSVERAITMAQRAAEAGAWAIKFQLYKADSLSVPCAPKYWNDEIGTSTQFEAFQRSDKLAYSDYSIIADACRDLSIVFFATPFDIAAVAALEHIGVPIYKIASGDITHKPLLRAVAETEKPIILSTGASTVDEIRRAMDWLALPPERLILLACTLSYPTHDIDGNFARLTAYQREFAPYLIGMSDHTLGVAGAWMTAALGGVCIEKHYTLDPNLPDVPDHAMSVDPAQLSSMVLACERGATLRGTSWIGVRQSEVPARNSARRSIVLERDVHAGHLLEEFDLQFKRPGVGIPPWQIDAVIGRTMRHDRCRGSILSEDDFR